MTIYHQIPTTAVESDLELAFGELVDEPPRWPTQHDAALVSSRVLPSSSSHASSSSSPAAQTSHDGVFTNMSAKPDNKAVEAPPSYNTAVLDATPPYWQTTILAPAGDDEFILVDGLPVGSVLIFFWNLLISASFQFVGFMLTYLLHTSHAGKNGSRAGLGISFVQFGFYVRSKVNWGDTDVRDDEEERMVNMTIISYFFMILGWFIIIRSVADYLRAKQMEKLISSQPDHLV
ncbi:hypothetical protein BC940DRAFT_291946 [Gongronella butleri]|nr:hypothetical protein BC940DRAFT_291946 [Gongronella butleri]